MMIVFGARAEYQRLYVIMHPIVIILLFYIIDIFFRSVDYKILIKNIKGDSLNKYESL